jgi:hypothetical protein
MSIKSKLFDYVGQQKKKSIEIAEIGETIYFGPITVAEMDMIRTMSSVNVPGEPLPRMNNASFMIWTIIKKAENEAGEKIFTDADRPFFDQIEYSIVGKLANAMLGVETPEQIKAKFKEGGDPFCETSLPSPTEKNAS